MRTHPPYQLPADITPTLVRVAPLSAHRERRVYTTDSSRGRAIMVQTFVRGGRGEMEGVRAPFFLFDRDAPELLAALGEAAAAIGTPPQGPMMPVHD